MTGRKEGWETEEKPSNPEHPHSMTFFFWQALPFGESKGPGVAEKQKGIKINQVYILR